MMISLQQIEGFLESTITGNRTRAEINERGQALRTIDYFAFDEGVK